MLKRVIAIVSACLFMPTTIPVLAENNTAQSVLASISKSDFQQYQDFEIKSTIEQHFSDEEIIKLNAQLNYSHNPEFALNAQFSESKGQISFVLKDNQLFYSDVFNAWHLLADNVDEYREYFKPKHLFKKTLQLSPKEIGYVEHFMNFEESEDAFIFSLKQNVDAKALSTALNQMFSERIDNRHSSAETTRKLYREYTSPEFIQFYLDQQLQIQLAFDKRTYLLKSITGNITREDGWLKSEFKFLNYGKQFDIKAPDKKEIVKPEEESPEVEEEVSTDDITRLDTPEMLKKTYKHGGYEVQIERIYLTPARDKFAAETYDHVMTVEYIVTNHTKSMIFSGSELTAYVDDVKAMRYYLNTDKTAEVYPGREGKTVVSFGFNGDYKAIELEVRDFLTENKNEAPAVIKVLGE
ncbi:hypothetical protein IU402_05910 [Aerococcaceae bacterium zg-BR9]|uniref:hypothetical protein n=1 Tax=Aerococcaceae bacterium zg-1292 TaxID=2774330 RepID=UPI0040627D3A|nr:hypothetical protein [Aerococcaceae bacterium zg-BR9]